MGRSGGSRRLRGTVPFKTWRKKGKGKRREKNSGALPTGKREGQSCKMDSRKLRLEKGYSEEDETSPHVPNQERERKPTARKKENITVSRDDKATITALSLFPRAPPLQEKKKGGFR